jgi:hypothetical protein
MINARLNASAFLNLSVNKRRRFLRKCNKVRVPIEELDDNDNEPERRRSRVGLDFESKIDDIFEDVFRKKRLDVG